MSFKVLTVLGKQNAHGNLRPYMCKWFLPIYTYSYIWVVKFSFFMVCGFYFTIYLQTIPRIKRNACASYDNNPYSKINIKIQYFVTFSVSRPYLKKAVCVLSGRVVVDIPRKIAPEGHERVVSCYKDMQVVEYLYQI